MGGGGEEETGNRCGSGQGGGDRARDAIYPRLTQCPHRHCVAILYFLRCVAFRSLRFLHLASASLLLLRLLLLSAVFAACIARLRGSCCCFCFYRCCCFLLLRPPLTLARTYLPRPTLLSVAVCCCLSPCYLLGGSHTRYTVSESGQSKVQAGYKTVSIEF